MNDKIKDHTAKLLNRFKTSPPTEQALLFLRCEKFPPGSDEEFAEQLLTCSVPARCTNTNEKQTPSPHYGVWRGH